MAACPAYHFHQLDSTNAEAQRLCAAGTTPPFWITADEQTIGRGRLGRSWISPPGNLYTTHVFNTQAATQALPQISFVAALAVYQALKALRPDSPLSLKWPNDVLLQGAKCCGILAEVISSPPTIIALGIGINLAHCPEGLPYPTAKLGADLKPQQVSQQLSLSLDRNLTIWRSGQGFEAIRQAWLDHANLLGQIIDINGQKGRFIGLNADGALILHNAQGVEMKIYAGDVRATDTQKAGPT